MKPSLARLAAAAFLGIVSAWAQAPGQIAIVNAASFRGEQPVAPGSIISIFGGFGTTATTVAPGFPLPTELAGVRVSVNNANVPLIFVSRTQINVQLPAGLAPGRYNVRVTTAQNESNGVIRIMAAAPGVFPLAGTENPPRGAILNQDGVTVNSAATPAARGSVIIIYCTGAGAFERAVPDANANPGEINRSVSTPQVFIAGVEAEVLFSGRAPSLVSGAWQINVRIPDRAFIRGQAVMQVFQDGVDSNEVSVFVQ